MTNTESASGSPQSSHNSHAAPAHASMAASAAHHAGDQPFFDPVAYGNGPNDSVTDTSENAAVTKHSIVIGGRKIAYTATAGHLVTVDPSSSVPDAKMFYVAFTEDSQKEDSRPVTFFYNGGPGSSSVFVLLGSFAPRRIKTAMPEFHAARAVFDGRQPGQPARQERSGVSSIRSAPAIRRRLHRARTAISGAWTRTPIRSSSSSSAFSRRTTAGIRRSSCIGESYGTARSCVLAYLLHEDGVDLNGITLQSSILDYTQSGNPVGALPTAAADAWYHKKLGVAPTPTNLGTFAEEVAQFARTDYLAALAQSFRLPIRPRWKSLANTPVSTSPRCSRGASTSPTYDSRGNSLFLTTLLKSKGLALGEYDGRVTAIETGIAGKIDPNSGGNDPTMTAVTGVYTTMWNVYLNEQLLYTSNSAFTDLNDQAFPVLGLQPYRSDRRAEGRGFERQRHSLHGGRSRGGDGAQPGPEGAVGERLLRFRHAVLSDRDRFAEMPLVSAEVRQNLSARFYPSGHMVYLDGPSRTALKADVAKMYDATVTNTAAVSRIRALQARKTSKAN